MAAPSKNPVQSIARPQCPVCKERAVATLHRGIVIQTLTIPERYETMVPTPTYYDGGYVIGTKQEAIRFDAEWQVCCLNGHTWFTPLYRWKYPRPQRFSVQGEVIDCELVSVPLL